LVQQDIRTSCQLLFEGRGSVDALIKLLEKHRPTEIVLSHLEILAGSVTPYRGANQLWIQDSHGLDYLSELIDFTTLEAIGINGNCLLPLLERPSLLPELRELQLIDATLSEAEVHNIAQVKSLKFLTLESCRLPSPNVEWIKECKEIESLRLLACSYNGSAIDISAIQWLPKLKSIELANTNIANNLDRLLDEMPYVEIRS